MNQAIHHEGTMGHDIHMAQRSDKAAADSPEAISDAPGDKEIPRGNTPSLRPDALSSEPLVDERAGREPGAFLQALLPHLDSEERRQLHEDLTKAEREGKCIRRAVFLMVVLLMLSAAGLGYCALLVPEVFRDPSHPLIRMLSVAGLGSLISQVVFLGHLLW